MKKKEIHTFCHYQFKHTAVRVTNHPGIQTVDVAEALNIHPIMLYRWRGEMCWQRRAITGLQAVSIAGLNNYFGFTSTASYQPNEGRAEQPDSCGDWNY